MHTEVTILNVLIMKVFCFHYRPCNFYNLMNRIKKKWLFIWLNSKLQIWDREIVHLFILIAPYLHPQPLNKWNWKRNWMIVLANFGFSHNFTTLFIKWPLFDFWTEKIQIPNRMKWYCFVVLLLLEPATTKNKTVETLFDLIINQMRKEFFKMAG